jgi:hypothetical protein
MVVDPWRFPAGGLIVGGLVARDGENKLRFRYAR